MAIGALHDVHYSVRWNGSHIVADTNTVMKSDSVIILHSFIIHSVGCMQSFPFINGLRACSCLVTVLGIYRPRISDSASEETLYIGVAISLL